MTDDVDNPLIESAILELSLRDAAQAGLAEEALGALTWGEGAQSLTQDRVQRFLWYELPLKWAIPLREQLEVTHALAAALDLLELPRYAAICRDPRTATILGSYLEGATQGVAAFRRANAASGIEPPDLPELRWGAEMGSDEARAYRSAVEALELAVTTGQLVPGTRGCKERQRDMVRAHLTRPIEDLDGQTLMNAILTERLQLWLDLGLNETRRKLLAAIANRLLHPAELPPGSAGEPSRLAWLLEQLVDGVALTQTGNLGREFVRSAAGRFGWDLTSPPRSQNDLYELQSVRRFAQGRLRLARRAGRRLVLTAKGRLAVEHPEGLWRTVGRGLLSDDGFDAFCGEIALAMLVNSTKVPADDLYETVAIAAAQEGYREAGTGQVPRRNTVSRAVHETINLCDALGLLLPRRDWRDSSYGLTAAGTAVALEALRARATGEGEPRLG